MAEAILIEHPELKNQIIEGAKKLLAIAYESQKHLIGFTYGDKETARLEAGRR